MKVTKILIVDDHPAMRHGLAQLIGREPDLEVCGEAGTRSEVMDAVSTSPPDFVVLDIALKDKSSTGLDLIRDIHKRLGPIPILIVSMHDESLYAERALHAGARGYLMKQEPVRQVIAAVRRILAGGVYVSEEMNAALLRQHVGPNQNGASMTPVERLSGREFEVFRLIGKGLQPREIGTELFLSTKTVETHRLNMRRKLGFANASDLTRFAVDWFRSNE